MHRPSLSMHVKQWPPRRAELLALALLGTILAGCSSTTLTSAAALGAAGKTAATTMQQAALVSPTDMQRLMTSDAFMLSYSGNATQAALAQRHDLIKKIQQELAVRAAVLESLANTYAAFASLASYDASDSFNTALTDLVKNTNAYLAGAKMAQLPMSTASPIPTVGGLLVGMSQKQRVREASARIVPLLNQVIAAMEKYEADFIGLKEIVTTQEGDAATVLYGSGFFSAVQALNAIGAPYGYTASANAEKMLADPKYRSVRTALAAAQTAQMPDQLALVATAFDQSLAALKKLPAQHAALENDAPIDLSQLATDLSALQTTVSQLAAALAVK